MLAVSGRPPDTASSAIEMKWDGARAIVVCETGICHLYSRNRNNVTGSYPELAAAIGALMSGRNLILDGEVIAQDADGTPSFGLLQRRMNVVRPSTELIRTVPVQLYVFDVLAIGQQSTMVLPYLDRRARLDDLALAGSLVTTPPFWQGVPADRMLAVAAEHRLEGIVSKRIDSVYHPGQRSPAWIKTPLRKTAEVVVVGWTPGAGMMSATFGSLVLGGHDEQGRLVPVGSVGTGFTLAARRSLRRILDELASPASPFDGAPRGLGAVRWVAAHLVGEVEYREYTGAGLRHPSWRGLRTDKSPSEVGLPS